MGYRQESGCQFGSAWHRQGSGFWLGPLAQPAARAIEMFGKHYMRAQDSSQRARFVDLICKAFDEALNAGKQGEIDPVHAANAMTAYERMTGIRSASAEFS